MVYYILPGFLGTKYNFELIENFEEISVMHNARIWKDPLLDNVSKEIIDSIFQSDFFKEYVYQNKFTQYNEMGFMNKLAIPPLDRIWTSDELKEWYLDINGS